MAPKISPIPKPSKKCLPKYDIQQFQTNAPQPPDGSIPAQLKIQGQASSLPPRPPTIHSGGKQELNQMFYSKPDEQFWTHY